MEEFAPLSLELSDTAAAADKYVCQLLCISYYLRFIINSCFKSEVHVIVTNDCIALPIQKKKIIYMSVRLVCVLCIVFVTSCKVCGRRAKWQADGSALPKVM